MYAKINVSARIRSAVGYNERKVQENKAERIVAENFIKDLDEIDGRHVRATFKRLADLNEKVTRTVLHISLSFAAYDQPSSLQIGVAASLYMQKAGLDEQPYVVYLHKDTKSPHCHIVGSTIRPDGTNIQLRELMI